MAKVTREQLERILADAVFVQAHDFKVTDFGDGSCTLKAPFKETHLRPGGIVGGPLLMTLADVAFWLATVTLLGPEEMVVTTELKTSFLSASSEGDITCRAEILRCGRQLVYGTVECRGHDDTLLTHHTATYLRLGSNQKASPSPVPS